MLPGQGEAGTGNVVEAVRHCRAVQGAIRALQTMDDDEVYVFAKELRAPVELVRQVRGSGHAVGAGWAVRPCGLHSCLLRCAWLSRSSVHPWTLLAGCAVAQLRGGRLACLLLGFLAR